MSKQTYRIQVQCDNCLTIDVLTLPFGKEFLQYDANDDGYLAEESGYHTGKTVKGLFGIDVAERKRLHCKHCGLAHLTKYGAVSNG